MRAIQKRSNTRYPNPGSTSVSWRTYLLRPRRHTSKDILDAVRGRKVGSGRTEIKGQVAAATHPPRFVWLAMDEAMANKNENHIFG